MLRTLRNFLFLASLIVLVGSLAIAQAAASGQSSASTPSTSQSEKPKTTTAPKVDINSASKDDLQKLPGIDSLSAQRIIDGRPYSRKDDLVKRNVLDKASYDAISAKIIAHQPRKPSKKSSRSSHSK